MSQEDNDSFPEGFKFAVASASYQVEGAWNVSGKKLLGKLLASSPDDGCHFEIPSNKIFLHLQGKELIFGIT